MANETLDEFRRGWRALLASSIGYGSGLGGIPYYTFGVFVLPLVAAFGWKRGEVSIAASFLIVGTAITAPIIGGIIDRYGARRVGIVSMAALAFGYAALTQLGDQIAMFYAAWLAMSLIGGGTTPVVWTRTVNIWFDRGRGLALGLALAGSGLASIFGPLLTTLAIESWGWQGGYLVLGAFILFVSVPVLALFFFERSMEPAVATGEPVQPIELGGYTLHEALRSTVFWKIAVGFFFVSGVVAGLIINLVPLLVDRGLSKMDAASVAGVMGIAVLIGRVGTGFLLDRFHAPAVARTLLGLCAIGCFLLSIPDAPRVVVLLSVISLGLAAAAEVDLVAYLTSRFCGMRAYGRIYGFQLSAFYAGAAVGPLLAGLAYDRFQSYLPMLYTAAGALVFGAIVTGTLGRPPQFATAPAH